MHVTWPHLHPLLPNRLIRGTIVCHALDKRLALLRGAQWHIFEQQDAITWQLTINQLAGLKPSTGCRERSVSGCICWQKSCWGGPDKCWVVAYAVLQPKGCQRQRYLMLVVGDKLEVSAVVQSPGIG